MAVSVVSNRGAIQAISQHALVAQLDRATDYESVGREFESLQARQKFKDLGFQLKSFFCFLTQI